MIGRWALPGPARALADIAASVAAGEHVVLRGTADFEFRLALEPLLTHNQRHLRPVQDEPLFSPAAVLWRNHCSWHAPEAPDPPITELVSALGRDTWWVESIDDARAAVWSDFLTRLAETVRNFPPRGRPTLVLWLPETVPSLQGLTIVDQVPPALTRADLDVAARYATADAEDTLAQSVRVALAVEIAALHLPNQSALEVLQFWLDAPDTVLTDPAALENHAGGPILGQDASLLLWRAQIGPVTRAIDQARCDILRIHASCWRTPYTRSPSHSFPATIVAPAQLEISDLIEQLGISPPSLASLLVRLKDLRHARNRLSHLSPVTGATFHILAQPPPLG